MSKYIRTKDGRIVDLTKWTKTTMNCIDKDNNVSEDILYQYQWFNFDNGVCHIHNESISHNNQVVKEANTIEELTDRYILNTIDIIILNTNHTQYRFEHSDEWFDITDTELRYGIFSAIWTEWGLKYVAKLNKDGEFELI